MVPHPQLRFNAYCEYMLTIHELFELQDLHPREVYEFELLWVFGRGGGGWVIQVQLR